MALTPATPTDAPRSTKTLGQEEILMHTTLTDSAKCLGCSLGHICLCRWSWGCCFWTDMVKPRSYVQARTRALGGPRERRRRQPVLRLLAAAARLQ